MAKVQNQNTQIKKKQKRDEEEDVLVGRVKKVVKKSRRKLSEEKFEKQLQRTIIFLEELQTKLNDTQDSVAEPGNKKPESDRKARQDSVHKRNKTSTTPVKQAAKATTKSAK